jgi:hypothetical protein
MELVGLVESMSLLVCSSCEEIVEEVGIVFRNLGALGQCQNSTAN